jgi:hypothetical protein
MKTNSEVQARRVRMAIAGGIILLIGVVIFGGAMLAKSRTAKTAKWPSVKGRITRSEIVTSATKTGPVVKVEPVAEISYDYSVEGRQYEGYRLRVIPMLHSTAPTPEETVARYRLGKTVEVYYDPDDPADALLTPVPGNDAAKMMTALFYVGPCVGLIGIGLFVLAAPSSTSRPEQSQTKRHRAAPEPAQPAMEHEQTFGLQPQKWAELVEPSRSWKTHWLTRTVATLIGLFFVLFGSLALIACFRVPVDLAVAGGAATRIVSTVLFACLTLFGAYLIRVGVAKSGRKRIRQHSALVHSG